MKSLFSDFTIEVYASIDMLKAELWQEYFFLKHLKFKDYEEQAAKSSLTAKHLYSDIGIEVFHYIPLYLYHYIPLYL